LGSRTPLTLRRPRAVLVIAALVLVALGVIGLGVEGRLDPTTLDIPGTDSSKANQLVSEHFGDSAPFVILLRGPAAALDRQGPELIRALRRDPKATTLSPWDRGNVAQLRPDPRRALILADFHVDVKTAVNDTVEQVEGAIGAKIRPPVRATQTGYATISRAIQDESISSSEQGELLALPFLLLVLLLVFRSPVAAAIPLGFGAVTVIASRGILHFFTSWFSIDAFALTVCTMMGLALGVDYALLMVSRFREELTLGKSPQEAALITRRTAGRTTIFAGSTLLISMLVSIFVVPGPLLASLAGTVAMVVVLSVAVATLVGPALLVLVGPNINRWRIGPAPNGDSGRLMVLVTAALKRPALAAVLIGGVVLVLSAPAIALKTGPPSTQQLPQDAPARKDVELIASASSPGFEAPYQVVAASREGPITDAKNLDALERWQRRIAQIPGVQLVIGPAQVSKRTAPLQKLGNAALSSGGNIGPVKQLGRLGKSLKVAAGGVEQLRGGISEASDGAGLLAQGSDRAGQGAKLIANGLGRAANGSQRAVTALDKFSEGAERLYEAQKEAAVGGLQLKLAARDIGGPNLRVNGLNRSLKVEKALEEDTVTTLPRLLAPAKVADEQLKAALAQLGAMTVGKTDPAYGPALEAARRASAAVSGIDPVSGAPYAAEYTGLTTELEALQAGLLDTLDNSKHVTDWLETTLVHLDEFADAAERLSKGLYRIQAGSKKLSEGAKRLDTAANSLGSGLTKLSSGAVALVAGIHRLSGGAQALEDGLAEAVDRSAPLQDGLERASVSVISGKARINHQARRVRRATPGLFNSGFFVLSELDGANPRAREAVSGTIDLNSGQAASMTVISKYSFNTPGSIALNKRLNEEAKEFTAEAGLATGVAGGVAQVNEFSRITRDRIPLIITVITLVTFMILIVVLRSIPLAAIAVGLNLSTVAVAFGVLTLLFNVPAGWPLGGNSYVDAVTAVMIFGVVFGLSIDYAVFLLSRMREHYDRHGDNAAAITFGLEKTARVITGAAAIMMAVFIAFGTASIAGLSQLGIGLTIAVLLDATVVRIVLLPALMLLLGDRVWWLPRWMDRALPKFEV
jgi:putative drug exporter of the RND superfamily